MSENGSSSICTRINMDLHPGSVPRCAHQIFVNRMEINATPCCRRAVSWRRASITACLSEWPNVWFVWILADHDDTFRGCWADTCANTQHTLHVTSMSASWDVIHNRILSLQVMFCLWITHTMESSHFGAEHKYYNAFIHSLCIYGNVSYI